MANTKFNKQQLPDDIGGAITTDNTPTIELTGDGTPQNPLKAEFVGDINIGGEVTIVGSTGSSITSVMHQKAVTEELELRLKSKFFWTEEEAVIYEKNNQGTLVLFPAVPIDFEPQIRTITGALNTDRYDLAHYNGKIYIPASSNVNLIVYDIAAGTITNLPILTSATRYQALVWKNFLLMPISSTSLMDIYDMDAGTIRNAVPLSVTATRSYDNAVVFNDKMYSYFNSENQIEVFDLKTETIELISFTTPASGIRRMPFVYNNYIYSWNGTNIDVFNPSTKTYTTKPTGSARYPYGQVVHNDKVYITTNARTANIFVFDLKNETGVTVSGDFSVTVSNAGIGIIGNTIYAFSSFRNFMIVYDILNGTVERVLLPYSSGQQRRGNCLSLDGRIYSLQRNVTTLMDIFKFRNPLIECFNVTFNITDTSNAPLAGYTISFGYGTSEDSRITANTVKAFPYPTYSADISLAGYVTQTVLFEVVDQDIIVNVQLAAV